MIDDVGIDTSMPWFRMSIQKATLRDLIGRRRKIIKALAQTRGRNPDHPQIPRAEQIIEQLSCELKAWRPF